MATQKSGGGLKWLILSCLIVAVVAGGFWYFKRGADDGPQYETVPVARGNITQTVTATGSLNPVLSVTVGSQVSGRIIQLNVDYNSVVKSNEVIAEIDPSTYEAQLNQAEANLASAKANLELQEANLERAQKLYTNNLVAKSDYDTAVATRDEAAAQVQIQAAAVTDATANLGYCKIRSPMDGVVITRAVSVGQTVASSFSTPELFQIANSLKEMQIDTAVDEADIGGVRKGQPVDFTVDAYPNLTFHGVVTQVRNAPTNTSNVITYDAVVGVNNANLKLKPGMTANVSIIVSQHNHVLEIPNSALRFQPPATAVIETNELAATGTNTNFNRGGRAGFRAGERPGFRGGRGGFRGGDRRGGFGGFAREAGGGETSPFQTVYLLVTNSANDSVLKAVRVKTGITDNINTEVLSGLKEGEQVVSGLVIPGLAANQNTRNPFAPHRRF